VHLDYIADQARRDRILRPTDRRFGVHPVRNHEGDVGRLRSFGYRLGLLDRVGHGFLTQDRFSELTGGLHVRPVKRVRGTDVDGVVVFRGDPVMEFVVGNPGFDRGTGCRLPFGLLPIAADQHRCLTVL